jgi:hypothetical protein
MKTLTNSSSILAVYYRVLLNDNHHDLVRETLQQITFTMSFQYTTATKAPRDIPVIRYSSRLANQVYGMFQVTMDD